MNHRKLKAKIFDIQRFSVHDGDGIRTTVFFKGCSQKCVWCHNPEGISFDSYLMYSKSKCIFCKTCEVESNGKIKFDKDNLINIDQKSITYKNKKNIEKKCPTGALEVDTKIMSIEELYEEVIKDRAFYKYGGGFTASGGECLLQSDFLEVFLGKLKRNNISTAIETSLCVPKENVDKVIDKLDIIYFDLKLMNYKMHHKYVSDNLKLVLSNAEHVLTSPFKDRVIVRTPLIPGITDNSRNIANIAKYISNIYPDVNYELLNYNELADAKYKQIGLDYDLEGTKSLNKDRFNQLIKVAKKNGVKNIIE